jgi:4-amino-4-deoxy-L-arabinose transferase-like glycosyltransferase
VFSSAEARELEEALAIARETPVSATRAAGVATEEPPLYYTLELIPYELGGAGSVLDRVELMRLLSAAMAGLTALFLFLFLREALPRASWAWTVGAGAVAVTPMLGFMSGAVTPEALLYAVSAATFFALARAFRRGLTIRRAALIAGCVVVGLLTKVNFVGLLPGIALGLIMLVGQLPRASRTRLLRVAGLALVVGIALLAVAYAGGVVSHSTIATPEASARNVLRHGSLLGRANYVWQFFLPRIPGTANDFPGIFTTRQIWFDGFVGLFGWLDTTFPGWVYDAALVPAGLLTLLALRSAVVDRAALRARLGELLTYLTMAIGLLVLIGLASYAGFPKVGGAYAQSRYLLPLLALLGAGIALAVRGAGRRWGPALGVVVLMLFVAHDLFAQLQVIARYYG